MEEGHKEFSSDYENVESILESQSGTLYKAVEKSSARTVLIKVYFPSLTWSESLLNEFFNRVSYLQFIEHDNLLPILDMGKHQDAPFVVYPYLSGNFLTARTFLEGQEKVVLDFFHEIADALDFLHKQEILHGALCAGNILVDESGHPKLYDHGLSEILKKLVAENVEDGFSNLSLSDIHTTSPEQVLGRNPTRQSDVYSFGMLLLFALLGEYPVESNAAPEIGLWHLGRRVTRLISSRKISRRVLQFVQKCIQVDPDQRFIGFAELLRVLERVRMGRGNRLVYKERLRISKPVRVQKNRMWWAAIPLALVVGVAWFFWQSSPPQIAPPVSTVVVNVTETPSPVPTLVVTATEASSSSQPTPTESLPVQAPVYRPAMEGQSPQKLSEPISFSNLDGVREVSRLGFGKPEHADISSSGKYAAVATSAGVFIASGSRFETWIDPQDWATAVQFSGDDKVLAVGVKSGDIQLWDWENGVLLYTLKGHTGQITRILFSNNGRFLFSGSYDQSVIMWNLASQSLAKQIAAHSEPVNDFVVTSDGRTLATVADDHLVRIWDLATATKNYEVYYPGKLQALALSSDDVYLAIGDDLGFIRQINIRTAQLRTDPIPVEERVWSLQYIENDNKLLAGLDGGRSRVFNASQMSYGGISLLFGIEPAPLPLVKIFGFDFVFNSFAVSSGRETSILTSNWNGEVKYVNTTILPAYFDSQDTIDFSEDGTILAVGGKRQTTVVWNIQNNRNLYREYVALPKGDPISPDGKFMVIWDDGLYTLVSLATGTENRVFSAAIDEGVISYADQGNILIASNLRESRVWDYKSTYETYLDSYPENGCFVTLSANNGEVLQVNTAAGVLPQWNETTKPFCAKSFLYANSISAVSTNMELYVYRSSSGFVEAYSPVNGKVLWRYPADGKPKSKVLALAVSSDGSLVVVGDESGTLQFVDGPTGALLTEMIGNFGSIQVIEFSANDMKLAVAGTDGAVRVFGVIK